MHLHNVYLPLRPPLPLAYLPLPLALRKQKLRGRLETSWGRRLSNSAHIFCITRLPLSLTILL